jgi:hypothetical protein
MKRDEDGTIVAFERGEVVWGIDPFKQDRSTGDDPSARADEGVSPCPWLIISTE